MHARSQKRQVEDIPINKGKIVDQSSVHFLPGHRVLSGEDRRGARHFHRLSRGSEFQADIHRDSCADVEGNALLLVSFKSPRLYRNNVGAGGEVRHKEPSHGV